ncbi:MAG: hypothetical protein LBG59_07740 [Candidatus Peribacteria bacterium]|jgi:hypothetical protein|nr:hypothetical protein [Candidatus Peribacteria bacterium]
MKKFKETLQEKKELLKKGSVFPALSYLATGYVISFFVSTFFGAFLATSELGLVGATEYSQAIWGGERVVAFAVVALVLAGAIFDLIGKRINKKQGIITIITSLVFFILVALSALVFQELL